MGVTLAVKRCSLCGVEKPCGEFSAQPRSRDGLQSRCRTCANVRLSEPRVVALVCAHCGSGFDHVVAPGVRGNRPKTCSEECRRERNLASSRASSSRRWREEVAARPDRFCVGCGVKLGASLRQKWCSSRCHSSARAASKFGMTLSDYDAMLAAQGGVCAVCGEPPDADRRMDIDHCHDAESEGRMVVRGLAHNRCNVAIGYLRDSSERAFDAAVYLARRELDLRELCAA